jgi:hypothetical protein
MDPLITDRALRPVRLAVVVSTAVLASLASGGTAIAQHWPSEPVALAGGHILLAGDVSATYGSQDPGWFTYTDYDTSALRRIRTGLTVEPRGACRSSRRFAPRPGQVSGLTRGSCA